MDDGFLIFAFACLCGGTFILYERISYIYLEFAVLRMDPIAFPIAMEQMNDLFEQSKWQLSYLVLLWTTVFAVKWCYFAFFYPFLRAMSKSFNIYYKFSICFTVVSWLFIVIGEQLITCPYVGVASGKPLSFNGIPTVLTNTIYREMLSKVACFSFCVARNVLGRSYSGCSH